MCELRLVIIGAGPLGQAVSKIATDLDFEIWVVDDNAELVSEANFTHAQQRLAGPFPQVLQELEISSSTYCLIVTRDHDRDEQALFQMINRGAAYLGMIGGRRKVRRIFDALQAAGISAEAIAQVHAPVGLEIGSQTVPEIAVSICAELIVQRNRNGHGTKRLGDKLE